MDWSPRAHHVPLPHPRRDPYLGRARFRASMFLSLLSAAWMLAFTIALQTRELDPIPVIFYFIVGLLVLLTKISLVADLALAWVDRSAGLPGAPQSREIRNRFLAGVAAPLAILALGFMGLHSQAIVLFAIAAVLIAEFLFKFGPYGRWWRGEIHVPALKELLRGRLTSAADELARAGELPGPTLEASYLAVGGMAIRMRQPIILRQLMEQLAALPPADESERAIRERLAAVLRADRARLEDPSTAAIAEAEALRLIPAGHPRRLPLALFVATEALDSGDGESTVKALSLLHSRDIPTAVGRVLVNWLMLQGANLVSATQVASECEKALATFQVRRVARSLTLNNDSTAGDSYDRWLRKAKQQLESWSPTGH